MSWCQTRGCTLPQYHRGICTGPLSADARARAEAYLARPCTTPGCAVTLHHEVCVTPVDGGRRVSLTPGLGEFTPWPVTMRHGRREVTLWGLIRGVCTSPLGALFGLALLALCWLAGCA